MRAFADAMARGDEEAAKALLPDEAACAKASPDLAERCKTGAVAMRARIGDMADDFPKGAKVVSVKKSDEPIPVADAAIWEVDFEADGDRDTSELFTMKLGDLYYAGFPFKVDSKDAPQ